jgi:hypothetical protein
MAAKNDKLLEELTEVLILINTKPDTARLKVGAMIAALKPKPKPEAVPDPVPEEVVDTTEEPAGDIEPEAA